MRMKLQLRETQDETLEGLRACHAELGLLIAQDLEWLPGQHGA